jgi:hypothetical protein
VPSECHRYSDLGADGLGEAGAEMAEMSPFELTHFLTRSKLQMQNLAINVRVNGIQEPLQYVKVNGSKYIAGGNHRFLHVKDLVLSSFLFRRCNCLYFRIRLCTPIVTTIQSIFGRYSAFIAVFF